MGLTPEQAKKERDVLALAEAKFTANQRRELEQAQFAAGLQPSLVAKTVTAFVSEYGGYALGQRPNSLYRVYADGERHERGQFYLQQYKGGGVAVAEDIDQKEAEKLGWTVRRGAQTQAAAAADAAAQADEGGEADSGEGFESAEEDGARDAGASRARRGSGEQKASRDSHGGASGTRRREGGGRARGQTGQPVGRLSLSSGRAKARQERDGGARR